MARRAADYGFRTGGAVTVEMKKVKERKDAIVAQSNHGVESWLGTTMASAACTSSLMAAPSTWPIRRAACSRRR